mgnify:CR=1 FL=1
MRRKRRVRKKVRGTPDRPRLCVYRSNRHIYAQVIDDIGGRTLVAASTLSPELKGQIRVGGNVASAKRVGALIAQKCLAKGIGQVVFDRNGFPYHGRVKAVAEEARTAGLKF